MRLYKLLDLMRPPRKRVAVRVWHRLLGELRSIASALPGARGLITLLQDSSLSKADRNRVRLTGRVRDTVSDFLAIVDSLSTRPTRLQELIPADHAHYIGASDACQRGMGGVCWFGRGCLACRSKYFFEFPPHVQATLITATHPKRSISISDLELAALKAHKDILARHAAVVKHMLWIATDNRGCHSER
ncbi:hypothetical protein MHU86_5066 [Fragilaria crotonensis]|nr:hypothetical protein MHU86_5066 [Fragilaria crotonensis]